MSLRYNPLYNIWRNMQRRCKQQRGYVDRGIAVCERWLSFDNFVADMGNRPTPQHSVERVDNDLGYTPDNCVWATPLAQAHNRRSDHTHITSNHGSHKLQMTLVPRTRFITTSKDLEALQALRDELLYERQFHTALGLYV